MRHLRAHNLYAKIKKCKFGVKLTDFLSFIISPSSLQMDNSKIQVIHDWPAPQKVKEVQSFLGFTNFYHRFIANYSDITIPLTWLMCKDTPWHWLPTCARVFKLLKDSFTLAPILHHFDPTLPPIVETDASNYTITVAKVGKVSNVAQVAQVCKGEMAER